MPPQLRSAGFAMLLVCSTAIAPSSATLTGKSLVLSQSTTIPDRKAEADRFFEQGNKLLEQNQNEGAIASFQKALVIYRELKERQKEGQTLKSIGNVYAALKQPEKGIDYQKQALAVAIEIKDPDLQARALNNIGANYKDLNKLEQAIAYFEQSLAVAQSSQNFKMIAIASGNLAGVYNQLKDYPKAIAVLQEALVAAHRISDLTEKIRAFRQIGASFSIARDYSQALAAYQKGLTVAQEIQDKAQIGGVLVLIGDCYQKLNQYEKAIATYQQALPIIRAADTKSLEVDTLEEIGKVYFNQKQYDSALKFYQQALQVAQQSKNIAEVGKILAFMGDCYGKQEQYEKAIAIYQQALPIVRESDNKLLEAYTLNAIGLSYFSQRQFEQAIPYYQQALAVFQKLKKPTNEWSTLNALGDAYSLKGGYRVYLLKEDYQQGTPDYQQAIPYYEQALAIARTVLKDRPSEASTLEKMGRNYFFLKEFQKAQEFLGASLKIYREVNDQSGQLKVLIEMMRTYHTEALAFQTKNEFSQEIHQANLTLQLVPEVIRLAQALQDPDAEKEAHSQESSAYSAIGNAYIGLQDLQQANEFIQKGLTAARQSGDAKAEMSALTALSGVYTSRGEYYKAAEVYQQMIAIDRKQNDLLGEGFHLSSLGGTYAFAGELQKAIQFDQQVLQKVEQIDPTKLPPELRSDLWNLKFIALNGISLYSLQLGNYDQAMVATQKQLQFVRSLPDAEKESGALMQLGDVYAARQTPKLALDAYQQAWEIAQKLGKPDLQTNALIKLSGIWIVQGDNAKALEFAQQAFTVARNAKTTPNQKISLERSALSALTSVYAAQGNYAKVLELLQQTITVSKQDPNPGRQALDMISLGQFYSSLGDYPNATAQFQQVLKIGQTLKIPLLEAAGWHMLAGIAFAQRNPEKTVEFAQKGAAIARQNQMLVLESAANAALILGYGELKNEKAAMAAVQSSLAISKKLQDPNAEKMGLFLLGSLHARFGRPDAAIAAYQAALAIQSKPQVRNSSVGAADSDDGNAGIYAGLAKIYADRNQPELAIAFYKQAISGIEKSRRNLKGLSIDLQKSFLQTPTDFGGVKTADIYRQLADLLLQHDRILEARQVIELLKLQELDDYSKNTRGKLAPLTFLKAETELLRTFNIRQQSLIQITQELATLRLKPDSEKTPADKKRIRELDDLQIQANETDQNFV